MCCFILRLHSLFCLLLTVGFPGALSSCLAVRHCLIIGSGAITHGNWPRVTHCLLFLMSLLP